MARDYQLLVRKGPKPGQIFPLTSVTMIIGRDPMSDIIINDPEVSRQHARLVQTSYGYQLEDLGSMNGTYVNGERVGLEPVRLRPGQEVMMGSGIILVYQESGTQSADDIATALDMPAPGRRPAAEGPRYGERPARREPEWQDERPQPFYEQPLRQEPPPLYVPPAAEDNTRRRNTIIMAVVLILLCCCCGFFLSAWYVWGDPLLQALGF